MDLSTVFSQLLTAFIFLSIISLSLATLLLGWIFWRVKSINVPPDADFATTLRATPLSVVIFLDLLDFGLDFFAVPIAWIVLGRLGLGALRGVSIVEEFIPGTQILPVMTLAWIGVRLKKDWNFNPRKQIPKKLPEKLTD